MKCKVCSSDSNFLFSAQILQKHEIQYFRCDVCGFIQTEQPYWLDEAYRDAIASLDTGYVSRNLLYRDIVASILKKKKFISTGKFLDYGGGYGLFVRLMRDKGFDFYRQDTYCKNLFAQYFDVEKTESYELVTAFEVFEHLENPLSEIEKILQYANSVLFSTELQPDIEIKSINDWWYFVPETGQHISFYTRKSLQCLAEKFNLNLYTNNRDLHLLTNKKLPANFLINTGRVHKFVNRVVNKLFWSKKGLLQHDFEYVRNLLHTNQR